MMHYIVDYKSQSFSSQTEQLINKIVNSIHFFSFSHLIIILDKITSFVCKHAMIPK